MNRGKFVIAAMVAVGLSMAIFAWWARYSASQRVLSRFGPSVAVAVRNGERVEFLGLATTPQAESTGSIHVRSPQGETELFISSIRDITNTPGLIHARHHLLHEKGFEWGPPNSDGTEAAVRNWTVALRFTKKSDIATWVFDFDQKRAYIVERDTEIGMAPIAPNLREFLSDLK